MPAMDFARLIKQTQRHAKSRRTEQDGGPSGFPAAVAASLMRRGSGGGGSLPAQRAEIDGIKSGSESAPAKREWSGVESGNSAPPTRQVRWFARMLRMQRPGCPGIRNQDMNTGVETVT